MGPGNTLLVTQPSTAAEETTLELACDEGKKYCTTCYLICQARPNDRFQTIFLRRCFQQPCVIVDH